MTVNSNGVHWEGRGTGGAASPIALAPLGSNPFRSVCRFAPVGGSYGAGDVIALGEAALLVFANVLRQAGDRAIILGYKITIPTASITARFCLHLYPRNTKTPTADNAAYAITVATGDDEDEGSLHIDSPGAQTLASGVCYTQAKGLAEQITSDTTAIYGELQCKDAVTIDSTEEAAIEIWGLN